jgi:hypothetical protein
VRNPLWTAIGPKAILIQKAPFRRHLAMISPLGKSDILRFLVACRLPSQPSSTWRCRPRERFTASAAALLTSRMPSNE